MEKRSRKWWALTERQRRHDKSVKRQAWANAPRDYRYYNFVKPWKAQCRSVLAKAVVTGDLDGMMFPLFKKDANYTYW